MVNLRAVAAGAAAALLGLGAAVLAVEATGVGAWAYVLFPIGAVFVLTLGDSIHRTVVGEHPRERDRDRDTF